MYLDRKPVLEIFDEATGFQATNWLKSVDTCTIWNAIRAGWVDSYLRPPDIIFRSAAKALRFYAFSTNAEFLHIETKTAPVKAANTMSIPDRYHKPLKRAYRIICKGDPSLDREFALKAAVKSIIGSVGPSGLVLNLLVYQAMPWRGLATDDPAAYTIERGRAVAKETYSLTKYFNQSQVREAPDSRNGPDVTTVHKIPLGSHVLVYQMHREAWIGQFPLTDRQNETCTILDTEGPKGF